MEHPNYVPLLHRAYELWEELEAEEAGELFARVGLLVAGDPDAEGNAGAGGLLSGARPTARRT